MPDLVRHFIATNKHLEDCYSIKEEHDLPGGGRILLQATNSRWFDHDLQDVSIIKTVLHG